MCFVLFLNTTNLFNWPVFLIVFNILIQYSYVSNISVTKSSLVISQLFYSQELRSTNMQLNSVCVCHSMCGVSLIQQDFEYAK